MVTYQRNYIIDGKIYDVSDYSEVYVDGRWSDNGIAILQINNEEFIRLDYCNHQGSHDSAVIVSREQVIQDLLSFEEHPDRVIDALGMIGEDLRKYKPRDNTTGQFISEGKESKTVRLDLEIANLGREEIERRCKTNRE